MRPRGPLLVEIEVASSPYETGEWRRYINFPSAAVGPGMKTFLSTENCNLFARLAGPAHSLHHCIRRKATSAATNRWTTREVEIIALQNLNDKVLEYWRAVLPGSYFREQDEKSLGLG